MAAPHASDPKCTCEKVNGRSAAVVIAGMETRFVFDMETDATAKIYPRLDLSKTTARVRLCDFRKSKTLASVFIA
jgi:hypothetical protein